MLELSGLVKRTPFLFTDLDTNIHELEITEFTIADTKKLVELQKPIIENKDMNVIDQSDLIVSSRIICAVKVRATGEYFWNSIEDLTGKAYPNELGSTLYVEVGKLNPVSVDTTDEKKKRILSSGHALLIKRICQFLRRPVFEVMQFPASELEYWSLFFSIDDNQDKPKVEQETVDVTECKKSFREVWK